MMQDENHDPTNRPKPGLEEISFDVHGMHCAGCAQKVEKLLAAQPGVQSASVNFALVRATLRFDNAQTNADTLIAAAKRGGYTLAPRAAQAAHRAAVSKLLGHKTIKIPADIYGHLIGTVASDAVNGAANLIAHTVHTPEGVSTR